VTGLLARLAGILAQASIALFAISTFDTDYMLIRAVNVEKGVEMFEKQDIKVVLIRKHTQSRDHGTEIPVLRPL
jgi:uncharacterized protein